MKKFKFRLQPVLELRKMEEEQKKRRFGALQSEINAQQQQAIEFADQIRQQSLVLKESMQRGQVDRRQVAYYQSYVSAMRKRIARRIERVREIQQDLVAAREELARAARQTKIMEKLKERQQRRYDQALKRLEANQTDEMGQTIYLRNRALNPTEGH